jgi:ribosomal protein S18 acetylase RimI-like enzyme
MPVNVRRAKPADAAIVAEFNRLMALETENKVLDPKVLAQGVAAVLADSNKGFYLVAEIDGTVAGQIGITMEWSDWRNGWFWWIQSVYVRASSRRLGVFRTLYERVYRLAHEDGNVIGLRLYVEENNHAAQETYRRLGMERMNFLLFHRWPM